MGFGLSSRFFSISLSVLVGRKGAKAGHVGPHRGEREAKPGFDPIQGWSPSCSAEPPPSPPSLPALLLKPEPGAAHCHLGAVRKRRWSLSSSSQLFWRFVRHCGRSRRGGSLQRAASRAPMGTSPVSARRHSAITSLRMSATIRTFFMRPLAPPRRALNRCASALSG